MKKSVALSLILGLTLNAVLGEAAVKKNAALGPRPITITAPGVSHSVFDLLGTEKMREKANEQKVISDPNLKVLGDILLEKEKIWHLNTDYRTITIQGTAIATRDQARALLERYNWKLPIAATPAEIVELYYEEAGSENIKWDIAFCQALLETGFFTFGGTVVPEQNNFCGLGTTSATVRGAYFLTPRHGVRAHIQHLLAYCSASKPHTEIIDPRYYLVYKQKQRDGFFTRWYQLNGKWATGSDYAEKILNLHKQMLGTIAVFPKR